MKKIIMILTLVLTVGTSFAFSGGEVISKQALNAFKSEFADATDVAWTVGSNYYRVAFTLSDQKLFAFYDSQGEFIAATRYVSSFQLPLNLQSTLKKSFNNYWVTDLFELSNDNETSYYVTLENADTKIVLKSTDGKEWLTYQKNKKA